MADYQAIPDDDESPSVLRADATSYLRTNLPGWAPSDASNEVALIAAFAEEGATLYALERETETDRFRDFGTTVFGVPTGEPTPAVTTITVTARNTDGPYPYVLEAGFPIVIDAPAGRVPFTVITEAHLDAGTVLAGVAVQAAVAGSTATGATGPVLLDDPPAWVASVTVDAPATGGTDGETDEEHLDSIKRNARLLHLAAVDDDDHEMVAQLVPTVARCLVLDRYNADTSTADVDGAVTLVPIDINGAGVSSGTRTLVKQLVQDRSIVNSDLTFVVAPNVNNIIVAVTVAAEAGVDHASLPAPVEDAIRTLALSPALHGQPELGERRTWQQRKTIRLYKVSDIIDDVEGVAYVDDLTLSLVRSVSAAAVTDVITSNGHGFANTDPIKFSGLAGGAPLVNGTTYYVRDATTNTFKVAATVGGAAVDITTDITAGGAYHLQAMNVVMTGIAPLPNVTTVLVTVVDPS